MMTPERALQLRALAHDPERPILAAIRQLLEFIGEDPGREGLCDTPDRVARSLLELTSGYSQDPADILTTVFEERYDEAVTVRDIPFWSLCEHHLLPFRGHATIAYIPNGRVVGLSKIARLVHCFARRLQIQERLTTQIADTLETHLAPKGVAVVISAEHHCMSMRGVETSARTETSALRGECTSPTWRQDFLPDRRLQGGRV